MDLYMIIICFLYGYLHRPIWIIQGPKPRSSTGVFVMAPPMLLRLLHQPRRGCPVKHSPTHFFRISAFLRPWIKAKALSVAILAQVNERESCSRPPRHPTSQLVSDSSVLSRSFEIVVCSFACWSAVLACAAVSD